MLKYNRKAFFDAFKQTLDPTLSQLQVNGLEFLLGHFEADTVWTDKRYVAYALATIYHETAGSMQPVEEGYYLGSQKKIKAFQEGLRYFPFFGRGYVQLTWRKNYQKAGEALGIDLVDHPEKALEPEVAYQVLTLGMFQGWFTGKKFADYINIDKTDYLHARQIINGMDKAALIAGYARHFEQMLKDSAAVSTSPSQNQGAVSDANSNPQESDSPIQPPITTSVEQTKTEATNSPGKTTAVQTTVTQEQPKGDEPHVTPVQVSQGKWFSYTLSLFGGVGSVGTAIWGWMGSNLNAVGIGMICLTLIILALMFRKAILDAIRMQTAADPDKRNVT